MGNERIDHNHNIPNNSDNNDFLNNFGENIPDDIKVAQQIF